MRKKAKDTHYVLHPICSSTSLNHCFVLLRLLPHLAQVIRTPQSVITASDGAERWNRTKMEPGRGSSRASWKNIRKVPTAPPFENFLIATRIPFPTVFILFCAPRSESQAARRQPEALANSRVYKFWNQSKQRSARAHNSRC